MSTRVLNKWGKILADEAAAVFIGKSPFLNYVLNSELKLTNV